MFDEPVVYVDIETSGGSYRTSQIIEFAAIRVENGNIVDSFETLINPGSPIPFHITRLTGITTADVKDAPYFSEVAEQIHSILSGAIFIAHHVRFDYSFIKRQLELCNISFSPRMLCSVRLSRALYPEHKSHKLESIINRFNIKTPSRHRAFADAEVVKQFLKLAYEQHGHEPFASAVSKQLRHRSLPPNVNSDAFNEIPNTPGVYTFSDSSGLPIYIGKSVSLRKRVMSHFAQDTKIDKEMKLSLNTHSITFIETANELEALLLESQMVKEKLPVYNQQLRRVRKMYVLKSKQDSEGYQNILIDYIDSEDLSPSKEIYGVYSSKMKAKQALESLQKTYELCPKLLGLEKSSRACFKYQLRRCHGACIGQENPVLYNLRFKIAFQKSKIDDWPYKKPIVVTHLGQAAPKHLVIDNWNVIGELQSEEGCETQYKPWHHSFDIDTYKIIRSYLANKSQLLKIQPISYSKLSSLQI